MPFANSATSRSSQQTTREGWSWTWLEQLLQDVRLRRAGLAAGARTERDRPSS